MEPTFVSNLITSLSAHYARVMGGEALPLRFCDQSCRYESGGVLLSKQATEDFKSEIRLAVLDATGHDVRVHRRPKRGLVEIVCSRKTKYKCEWKVTCGKTGAYIHSHAPGVLHSHEPEHWKGRSTLKHLYDQIFALDGGAQLKHDIHQLIDSALQMSVAASKIRSNVMKRLKDAGCTDVYQDAVDALIQSRQRRILERTQATPADLINTLEALVGSRCFRISAPDGVLKYVVWTLVQPEDTSIAYVMEWVMDTTFNTNTNGLTLLGFCARGPDLTIVPLAFALCSDCSTATYTSIMHDLKEMLPFLHPRIHKADGELALHKAAVAVFGGLVRQCVWHLFQQLVTRFRGNQDEDEDPFTGDCIEDEEAASDFVKIEKNETSVDENSGRPAFQERVTILFSSACATDFDEALVEFERTCTGEELRYFKKYLNPMKLAKYTSYLFGTDNHVSSDIECVWSHLKSQLRLSNKVPSAPELVKVVNKALTEWVIDKKRKLGKKVDNLRGKIGLLSTECSRDFLAYAEQFSLGAQKEMLAALFESHSIDCEEIMDGFDDVQRTMSMSASAEERLRSPLASSKRAKDPGLVLIDAFLNHRNELPQPEQVFKASHADGSVEYLCRFEAGYFCTCGKPLQTGIPCAHVLSLAMNGKANLCADTVASEFHEIITCQEAPGALRDPYFVREILLERNALDVLLGPDLRELPQPNPIYLQAVLQPPCGDDALDAAWDCVVQARSEQRMSESQKIFLAKLVRQTIASFRSLADSTENAFRFRKRGPKTFRKRGRVISDHLRAAKRRKKLKVQTSEDVVL